MEARKTFDEKESEAYMTFIKRAFHEANKLSMDTQADALDDLPLSGMTSSFEGWKDAHELTKEWEKQWQNVYETTIERPRTTLANEALVAQDTSLALYNEWTPHREQNAYKMYHGEKKKLYNAYFENMRTWQAQQLNDIYTWMYAMDPKTLPKVQYES